MADGNACGVASCSQVHGGDLAGGEVLRPAGHEWVLLQQLYDVDGEQASGDYFFLRCRGGEILDRQAVIVAVCVHLCRSCRFVLHTRSILSADAGDLYVVSLKFNALVTWISSR